MKRFEIAGGTVTGRRHKLIGKNNQDAYNFRVYEDMIIAVVSDGCGSGNFSEFGARLTVRLFLGAIRRQLPALKKLTDYNFSTKEIIDNIRQEIIVNIRLAALYLDCERQIAVSEYLSATILGLVITEQDTYIISLGDGIVYLNGEKIKFEQPLNNAPPYLAYSLLPENIRPFTDRQLQFELVKRIETEKIDSLIIGTDGLNDFIRHAERNMPGRSILVGDISQFWENDNYFINPDLIRRKLVLTNDEKVKLERNDSGRIIGIERCSGLLPDDTTLIVLRKIKKGGEAYGNQGKGS